MARSFTWEHFVTELKSALIEFNQRGSIQLQLDDMDHLNIRNFELGRLLSKSEIWPHGANLPSSIPFSKIMQLGAEKVYSKSSYSPPFLLQSIQDLEREIVRAREKRNGYSLVSLGDTECAFLGINMDVVEPFFSLPKQGLLNAGYDFTPDKKRVQQTELLEAIVRCSAVGIPVFRHGLIQRPLLYELTMKGIDPQSLNLCDSTAAYKMMEEGFLAKLLTDGNPRVLCIGNESQRLRNFLQGHNVSVVGHISPVNGFKDWKRVVETAAFIRHDVALVAAGAASIPICSHLASRAYSITLDIGKVADEWATGLSEFDGNRSLKHFLTDRKLTQHQRAFSLHFQTGYQHGLNELMLSEQRYPVNSVPANWVQEYVRQDSQAGPSIHSPIWLMRKMREAYDDKKPLAVAMLDSKKLAYLSQVNSTRINPLQVDTQKIDILGVPYLFANEPTNQVITRLQPTFPIQGWVDNTAVAQLQFDYYGRFLPLWLRSKRILLVAKNPDRYQNFLRNKGFIVWGIVNTLSGKQQAMRQIESAKRFEIALVSSGIETLSYTRFIAREVGKIAIDIGDILYDAVRGGINSSLWSGGGIKKMD